MPWMPPESTPMCVAAAYWVLWTKLYCIVLYCIVSYCIVLYCIVLYLYIYIALLAVHTNQKRFYSAREGPWCILHK